MAEKRLSVGLFLNDKQFQSNLRKASNSLKKFTLYFFRGKKFNEIIT